MSFGKTTEVCHAKCAEPLYHYCLIRADLPLGSQFAQALHAAGESAALLGKLLPDDTHAIALHAPHEAALWELSARLTAEGIPHKLILEPDMANQATALGIIPMPRSGLRKLLSKYPLIKTKEM